MGKDYETIVLSDDAMALHVNGEFIMVQKPGSAHMVAVAKLGEKDYIKLEQGN